LFGFFILLAIHITVLGTLDLLDRINGVLGHPEMANSLTECLSLHSNRAADEEFDAMVARVEGRFENSSNYGVVLQFIQDHSRLGDREVMRLFEFIYSSLVNKFKGELGELLARPALLAFLPILRSENVELILGPELASHQLRRRHGWYPAADALFCVRHPDVFEVVGIAEVKSKATPLSDLRDQVMKNILRLRRGIRARGEDVSPEAIRVRTFAGQSIPIGGVDKSIAERVPALMVIPHRAAGDFRPVRYPDHANQWMSELPYRQDDITEAAYGFMSWYFARIGPRVFYYRSEGKQIAGDLRRPAAHDDLSLEENGKHAFLEAIYSTTGRRGFDPSETRPPGRRTPWQTLLWLYNSLGFGYQQASTDEFMYPEFTPSDESAARVKRRDDAIAAYRAGRFSDALEQLPHPGEQKDRWWSRREWVMLARIHARNGDVADARGALRYATSMPPIESLSLPIEIAGVEVLIEIAAGDHTAAEAKLLIATATLDAVRAKVDEHASKGWELPSDIEPNSAREGVIDLAVAHAALGNDQATVALLTRLRQLRGWELDFFSADPVLKGVFGHAGTLNELRRAISARGELAVF